MDEAMQTIGIQNEEDNGMITDIAYNIANYAIHQDGSLMNEEVNGLIDPTRVWWGQAEAIVGFYNAFERTKDKKFLTIIHNLWNYIKNFFC